MIGGGCVWKVLCLDRRGQASVGPKIHRVTAANTKILLVSCQSEPKRRTREVIHQSINPTLSDAEKWREQVCTRKR